MDGPALWGWVEGDCECGLGKFIWSERCELAGSTYVGTWQDGKPHGEGTLTVIVPSGTKPVYSYKGLWVEGQRQGSGKVRFANAVYDGEFYQGRPHGKGRLTFKPEFLAKLQDKDVHLKETLEGEFKWVMLIEMDDRHPDQWICTAPWRQYVGQLNPMRQRHGKGWQLYFHDLEKYDGEFVDDARTGQGTLMRMDGEVIFRGTWIRNKWVKGEWFTEEFTHVGTFIDAMVPHGEGIRRT